jgi:hypothetical protein
VSKSEYQIHSELLLSFCLETYNIGDAENVDSENDVFAAVIILTAEIARKRQKIRKVMRMT